MAKLTDGKISFDRVLSALALVVGIVALFFSWQANRIASQQVISQVVVLSSDYNGGVYWKTEWKDQHTEHTVRCNQVIRLSNLGGAKTALIGYDAYVYYKDSELNANSENAQVVDTTNSFSPMMRNFEFVFLKDASSINASYTNWIEPKYYLPFPVQIDAFTTMDFDTVVSFLLNDSYISGGLEMPQYSYQYKHPQSFNNLPPLEVAYTLHFASGQTVKTPRMLCAYLK